MTPDQAIAKIKTRLYNWSGSAIDDIAESELQLAQIRLEHGPLLPWFLLRDEQAISASGETFDVPSGFIAEWDELRPGALWYRDANGQWNRLRKQPYDVLMRAYGESGLPKAYALVGERVYLRPIPSDPLTLRWIYFAEDELIQRGGQENGWLKYAPDLLIAEAGKVIATHYANMPQAAQGFEAMRAEAVQRLHGENVRRLEAAQERIFGGEY